MAEGLLKYLDKSAQGLSRIPRGLLAWAGDAAKRGLLDYNAALTGYDEAGQPVPHTMRALDLLGNTLPSVAPTGGVVLGAGPVFKGARPPIRAYHGSPEKFDTFEPGDLGEMWFSSHPHYAEGMAGRTNLSKRNVGHMYEVDIKANNPLEFDVLAEARKEAKKIGAKAPRSIEEAEELLLAGGSYNRLLETLKDDAVAKGHDAIVFKGTKDGYTLPTDQIVTFDPEMISILRKYGVVPGVGLTGGLLATSPENSEAFQ